jgi:hypothetical protein
MGIRITDLASASTVGLTDTLVLVQAGDTKKCEVSQVKTLDASEIVSGTLGVARLPVVPVSLGGTGSVDATSAVAALGAQPALTSSAPASILQGGTGATTAVAALDALGGITSAVVPSLVTAQLSAYALTSQLAPFQNSDQVQALTTAQLSSITFSAGTGLVGGGTLVANRTFALQTSGVSAGTFGSSTQIPVLTVDDKGRVTSVQNVTPLPGNNASDLTVGTLDPNRLATTPVIAGTYGSDTLVGQFIVDSKGRITNATNIPISGSAGGTVVSVGATSSTLAISNSPITYSGALQINLATTGVPAITAGSSTQSAVITVDSYGRVTALETQAIQSLSPSGVVSGSYGHPERVAQFTVDVNGIITGATEAAIAIPAAAVSGLAASATSDTTNAGNIITGTLNSDRISVLASSQIAGISAAQVGVGITSAQIVGIAAAQISGTITSAQITVIQAAQVGVGITAAQLSGGITSSQINTLPVAKISGLAASATTDTTVATNITTGTLAAARVGTGLTSAQIVGLSVTQISALGTGVSTFLQIPSSANLAAALTDETGSGANVFATSPTIATPTINGYTEGTVAVGTVGATATLAITAGTVLTATLTSATPCTFTMPAVGVGKSFALYLRQPASGTPTTATFTPVRWAAATPPTITATLGKMDILSFTSDGTNWYGSFIQNFTY